MDNFCFTKRTTRDADDHAAALSAWSQRYEQISAGSFNGHTEELRVGPVQLFHELADQAVLQSGMPRAGTQTIGLVQSASETGWFCGHGLEGDRIVSVSSDFEFDLIAGAGTNIVGISIDTAHLRALSDCISGRDDGPPPLTGPCALDAPPAIRDGLKALVESALSMARQQPAQLQQPAAQRMLALSLTEAALDCVGCAHSQAPARSSVSARRRILTAAREYMCEHADEPITVPDLCQATGASRRTLQYAFEEILHLSPVTYLRVMRLNRVRSELALHLEESVGDIAARWGFWHLSRFAADYRQHFGELPSATRARSRTSPSIR